MTAILQPGDVIHLALPISPMLYGDKLVAAGEAGAEAATRQHAQFGVTVAMVSHCAILTHPVVVAIFRTPAAGSDVA